MRYAAVAALGRNELDRLRYAAVAAAAAGVNGIRDENAETLTVTSTLQDQVTVTRCEHIAVDGISGIFPTACLGFSSHT